MEMMIFIPTRGRVDNQVTWDRMTPELKAMTYIVCPPGEVEQHERLGREAVACERDGIGPTRDFILRTSSSYNFRKILMLDDDLTLQRRRSDSKISNADIHDQLAAIHWLSDCLGNGFAHAGLAPRFLAFANKANYLTPSRSMYALAYDVPKVRDVGARFCKGFEEFEGKNTMEDFNMTLQLLQAGLPNVVSLEHRVTPRATNASGGCSTWRTGFWASKSAEALAELFPDVVRLRKKKAWQGMTESEIYDVTIYWQRALK